MAYIKTITILVCSMFLLTSVSRSKQQRTPDIFIKEPVWDFGTIEQYKKITHEFLIQNKGNADLIIDRVRSS